MKKILITILVISLTLIPTLTEADNTHSVDFEDGSSQYFYVADTAADLDITGDMTLETWYKAETLPPTTAYSWGNPLFSKYSSANQRSYILVHTGNAAGGSRSFQFWTSNDGAATASIECNNNSLAAGVWYYISLVYDAANGSSTIYWAKTGSTTIETMCSGSGLKTSLFNSTRQTEVGAVQQQGSYNDGLQDEIRIWNDKRTVAELNSNFKKEIVDPTSDTSLVAYWQVDNNLTDSSHNGYTTTWSGGAAAYSADVPWADDEEEPPAATEDPDPATLIIN